MTRPRHRRPTFSGPASVGNEFRTPLLDSASDSDQETNQMLNHRRGSRFGPATLVERWMRRNSSVGEQPYRPATDDDFGVGIPIDEMNTEQPLSDVDSLRSKPSTRRASNDSSIDDVCMPLDDDDRPTGTSMPVWPDVSVIDEYAKREAAEQADAEAAALVRESVNEAAEAREDGRLRPRRTVPWSRRERVRTMQNYRFTYFRDDLPATVHSPSIAGLLQPGQSFSELFPTPPERPIGSDTTHITPGAAHGAVPGTAQAGAAQAGTTQAGTTQAGPGLSPNSAAGGAAPSAGTRKEPTPPGQVSTSQTPAPANGQVHNVAVSPHTHVDSLGRPGHIHVPLDPGEKENFPEIHPDPRVAARIRAQQRLKSPSIAPSGSASCLDDSGPWWLDVYAPTEDEMRVLSRTFGIHPLTSEDIVLHETREKVELFHNYYFVCFTSFDVMAMEKKSRSTDENAADNSARRRRESMGGRSTSSRPSKLRRRVERLKPLAVYQVVFPSGIITIHYRPTPHTINVRRRIRLLRDYLNVSSDWISYALIDEITDAYQPLIASVEEDVQAIEEAILHMHGSKSDSDDSDASVDDEKRSAASSHSGSTSTGYREWRKKGNMLRWIGESRKRVMSLLSLLGNKADVIKGFSKRVSEHWSGAPHSEIAMYLSDIQDHLVTMTQSLNHYEKLLARSHSNYLAQINIDMTRANNDMNDQLSKISVLGTIVLPMNIVTGLWGMNVIVPGQEQDTLVWFWGICAMMLLFGVSAYYLLIRFV